MAEGHQSVMNLANKGIDNNMDLIRQHTDSRVKVSAVIDGLPKGFTLDALNAALKSAIGTSSATALMAADSYIKASKQLESATKSYNDVTAEIAAITAIIMRPGYLDHTKSCERFDAIMSKHGAKSNDEMYELRGFFPGGMPEEIYVMRPSPKAAAAEPLRSVKERRDSSEGYSSGDSVMSGLSGRKRRLEDLSLDK